MPLACVRKIVAVDRRNAGQERGVRPHQPIEARRAALIVIDVQNWVFEEQARVANAYFQHRLQDLVLPNLQRLIRAAREAGAEVMYTVIENLTRDGRDRSLDYKISGIFVAKGSWEAKVVDAIAPAEDDIVLTKTSSSSSTRPTATICSAISGSSI